MPPILRPIAPKPLTPPLFATIAALSWLLVSCAAPPAEQSQAADARIDGAASADVQSAGANGSDAEDPGDSLASSEGDVTSPNDSSDSKDGDDPQDATDPQDGALHDSGPGSASPFECLVDSDCAPFDDANPCNGTLTCNADVHQCVPKIGSAILCDTSKDTVCAQAECQIATATCELIAAPAGTPCVDGDPCSVDSVCASGQCKAAGSASWCECQKTADCAAAEDGDLCNGTLVCDKSTFPWRCEVDPTTTVVCSDANDTTCTKVACGPQTGDCTAKPQPDGAPCADGNPCTVDDACLKGGCEGINTCVCTSNADCDHLDDADACNGVLVCDKSVAGAHKCAVKPGSVPLCTAASATCDANACEPKTGACGVVAAADGKGCSDGQACTVGDACKSGKCASGTVVCACTQDSDCAADEDANACNGTLICDVKSHTCTLNVGTVVSCDSAGDTLCAVNACDPKDGKCSATPIELTTQECDSAQPPKCQRTLSPAGANKPTVLCNDGDPCTQNDSCAASKCVSGAQVCECKVNSDCAAKDDGNLCNGTFVCDKGNVQPKCVFDPKSVVACPTNNNTDCAKSVCFAQTGQCSLINVGDGAACNDGDACTTGDACTAGQCKGTNTCSGPTWTQVYDAAFANNGCGGCHFEYSGKSKAYNTLLNGSYCGGSLVQPGNAGSSTIVNKLGAGEPLSCGQKMPKGSQGISANALKLLKDWIAAGAKQN